MPAFLWLVVKIQRYRAFRTRQGRLHDFECLVHLPKVLCEHGLARFVLFICQDDRAGRPTLLIRVDDEVPLMAGQVICPALPAKLRTYADLVPYTIVMLVRDDKGEPIGESHLYVLVLALNTIEVHLHFARIVHLVKDVVLDSVIHLSRLIRRFDAGRIVELRLS